jgi:uncharacterized membrane protein
MKMLYTGLAMLSLAALAGCGGATGTSEKHAGGPGAATNASQRAPLVGAAENSFKISPPTFATHLKQGESKEIKIGIDRGKNFDEDVTLKFAGSPDMPKGLTFEPASPTIKHGDKEAAVTVKAKDDAAVGDFKIEVKGHPTKGPDAANTLEIKVEKKG